MSDVTATENDVGGAAPPHYAPPPPDDPPEPGPGGPEDEVRALVDPPAEDDEEILESKINPVERTLTDLRGETRTFVQRGLSWFGKIQLYGLLARATKVVIEDETGLGIDELLQMRNPRGVIDKMIAPDLPGADDDPLNEDQTDTEQAMKMLAAFARLVSIAPDLLMEAYAIVLGVPSGQRNWAINWGLPHIDDEMGKDILHTFVDQNWGVMEDFFTLELPRVFKRVARAHRVASGARLRR